MSEYLAELSSLGTAFFWMAIPATAIFLIMAILTFAGMDADGGAEVEVDVDADVDDGESGAFQMLTMRNMIHFLMFSGWGGLAILDNGFGNGSAIIFGLIIGVAGTILINLIFGMFMKLQQDNTPQPESAIGKTAEVYLRIPKGKSGMIHVNVGGGIKEASARSTDSTTEIASHKQVKITGYENTTYLVEEIK